MKNLVKGTRKDWVNLGLLLTLPMIIWIGFVMIYPVIYNVWLSINNVRLITPGGGFVGFDNFVKLLVNTEFRTSFLNDFVWTSGSVFSEVPIGLGIALLLNTKTKFRRLFRTLIILPWLTPAYATVFTWKIMFMPLYGFFNYVLKIVGLIKTDIVWLATTTPINLVMLSCIIVNVWRGLPFTIVILLAGLQSINPDMYEVAEVDGASVFQEFRYITLPALKTMIAVVIILKTVWYFNYFDIVWLMTRGGPGMATEILPIEVYITAFYNFQLSQAAAISVTMFLVLAIFAVAYFRLTSKGD